MSIPPQINLNNFNVLRQGGYDKEVTTKFFINSEEEGDLKKVSRFLTNTTNEELDGIFSLGRGQLGVRFYRGEGQYVVIPPDSNFPYYSDRSADAQLKHLLHLASVVKAEFEEKYWGLNEIASAYIEP